MNWRKTKRSLRELKNNILRFMKKILIMSIITIFMTLIICYFIDWTTIEEVSIALGVSSIVLIGLGGMSIIGSMSFRGNINYQLSRTTSAQSSKSRIDEDLDTTDKSVVFAWFMVCSSILPGVTSIILMLLQK